MLINNYPNDWSRLKIKELTQRFLNGGTPSTHVKEYWDGNIPWITGADAEQRLTTTSRKSITELGVKRSSTNIVPKGNILLVTRTGVGKVSMSGVDVAISQDLTGIIPKVDLVDVPYLYYQFTRIISDVKSLTQGSIIQGIKREEVENIVMPLPELSEQRAIADILSTLDEAIAQSESLVQKYQSIKQGLMSDLLTGGVDSVVGTKPAIWEVSVIRREFEIEAGFTLGQHRRPRQNTRKYLRVANVSRWDLNLVDIAELEVYGKEMTMKSLKEDDLLVIEGHANPNEIGRCAKVTKQAEGLTFQNHIFRLRTRGVDSQFALIWLNSDWVQGYWRSQTSTSSGLYTINRTMLERLPIPIPRRPEQEKIADIIFSSDQQIKTEESQLSKLKNLKQGLMQDLLSGQVRVKI
jgi:type I restriction enzyme, S subunit